MFTIDNHFAVNSVLKANSTHDYSDLEAGLKVKIEGNAVVSKSKDCVEGFTAFLEKREPVFTGK